MVSEGKKVFRQKAVEAPPRGIEMRFCFFASA
jgi:hypothetical protein